MKFVIFIIIEVIVKVIYKEYSGWGINNKETMNIVVDVITIFRIVFFNIVVYWLKYMNVRLYIIRGILYFLVRFRNWSNIIFLLVEEEIFMVWMKVREEMILCDDEILILYLKSGKFVKKLEILFIKVFLLFIFCLLFFIYFIYFRN